MARLSSGAALPASVQRPAYDRASVTPGIVHLGIGAFHRAHQAVYLDDRIGAGETGWGIVGASLRSAETRDALQPQDGLYTLAVRGPDAERLRVVGAVLEVLVAPEVPDALLDRLCDPRTRIVSLTVTEKGYCHDPATGELLEDHPDVVHDVATPHRPRSAPGYLVEALARRRAAGVPPFTALSCDNLPSNGRTLHKVLTRLAALRDPDLGRFLEGELACPSSMVDRIVPATTDEDRARVSASLGLEDAWPVVAEPFSQWVIEDRFPLGRPRLEAAGAELVANVEPYEHMKLRLLNGSHSAIAYLGALAGYETVSDAMADEALARYVRGLMDEASTTLEVPPGANIGAYSQALIERFRNPALRHRTAQIAMDGSQKLPQRLLGTIRDRLRAGAPIEHLALAVAAWMRYVTGIGESSALHEVKDPLASRLDTAARGMGGPEDLFSRLVVLTEVFGQDLPSDHRFREAVVRHLSTLYAEGTRRTLQTFVQEDEPNSIARSA